jgi:hypothetical protein
VILDNRAAPEASRHGVPHHECDLSAAFPAEQVVLWIEEGRSRAEGGGTSVG